MGYGYTAQDALICRQAHGRFPSGLLGSGSFKPTDERCHVCPHDRILDSEDLLLIAVEPICPEVVG
jgi:hypothetical protein